MIKIFIKNLSKNNRGVFAKVPIKKGEVIEVCPVIVLPLKERKALDKSFLFNYYFYWGRKNQPALALGYGSLYNHSYQPNAEYDQKLKERVIVFKALADIPKNKEITVNYNGEPDDQSLLWFRVS